MAGLVLDPANVGPVAVVVTAASALTLGVAYALIGVAVTAVAVATRTLHLAIGSILVLGVLTRVGVEAVGAHPALAVAAALVVGATASAALEPLVVRPLGPRGGGGPGSGGGAGGGPVATAVIVRWLVGLAVAAALLEVAIARWLVVRHVRPGPLLGEVGTGLVVAVVVGLLAAGGLGVALARSGWGRRLRVVGGSPLAAAFSGIGPGRVRAGAFAVSGAAAVLAGLLIAPVVAVGAGQGPGLTLRGVAAAVLFGVGGPVRAVGTGLLLGTVEAVAQTFAPGLRADVVIAGVVVLVVAWRGSELRREWGRAW